MGTREYVGMERAKPFPLKKFGETRWRKYSEVWKRAKAFGSGLRNLGMKPLEASTPEGTYGLEGYEASCKSVPCTLLIFEDTCEEWETALIGAATQSIVVATSYATLGISSVVEAINETNAHAVLCNAKQAAEVAKAASQCRSLKAIILSPLYCTEDEIDAASGVSSSLKVLTFEEVVEDGMDNEVKPSPAEYPETPAVVMYTSGSTGKPKGVVLTNGNLCSACNSARRIVQEVMGKNVVGKNALAYLPLAHIFELTSEAVNLYMGLRIGYADPRTLSSKGACRVTPEGKVNKDPGWPYPPGAIQEFRPHGLIAVPKIWDTFKKAVEDGLSGDGAGKAIKRYLMQVAYSGKCFALATRRDSPLFNAVPFGAVRKMFGGNLSMCVSGGGPIAAETQTFTRAVFAPCIQGYGLTETCAVSCGQTYWDQRNGVCGSPALGTDIKLVHVEDIKDRAGNEYKPFDTKHADGSKCIGRGEVCIRGGSVCSGYLFQKEKTEEVFQLDGWFRSGDVGLFLPDGSLKLIDRVKNLVKLLGGEYIAIENMESNYATCPYVNGIGGGILCYGDGTMDRPVALVQVVGSKIRTALAHLELPEDDDDLCDMAEAEEVVLKALLASGAKLSPIEKLAGVKLISGRGSMDVLEENSPWTPDNGGLTASNKLNRQTVQKELEPILEELKEKGRK
jgi:long-chain acyl-CoA synthetase